MRRVLHEVHTPRPLQEKATKKSWATIFTAGAGQAMGKDAALQVFAKHLLDISRGRMAVALAVELTGTGEFEPSLEVLGHRAVQQCLLGVAGVVGLWVRSDCGGLHGTAPCWALLTAHKLNAFAKEHCGIARAPFRESCPLEIQNTVTFTEQEGITTVTLRAEPFGEVEAERKYFEELRPSLEQGYGGTFEQLADYLAKG